MKSGEIRSDELRSMVMKVRVGEGGEMVILIL